MKKHLLTSIFTIGFAMSSFATTYTITNGFNVFTPATVNALVGDTIIWNLAVSHDVVEVDQSTWAANGNTPMSGGFSLPNGGGQYVIQAGDVGTIYYVCSPHASMGMKGRIFVGTLGLENQNSISMQIMQSVQDQFIKLTVNGPTTGKVMVDMMNLSGQVVKTTSLNLQGETSTMIEVGDLPKGVYMVRWSYGNINKAKKIILQ